MLVFAPVVCTFLAPERNAGVAPSRARWLRSWFSRGPFACPFVTPAPGGGDWHDVVFLSPCDRAIASAVPGSGAGGKEAPPSEGVSCRPGRVPRGSGQDTSKGSPLPQSTAQKREFTERLLRITEETESTQSTCAAEKEIRASADTIKPKRHGWKTNEDRSPG